MAEGRRLRWDFERWGRSHWWGGRAGFQDGKLRNKSIKAQR